MMHKEILIMILLMNYAMVIFGQTSIDKFAINPKIGFYNSSGNNGGLVSMGS
jgi:hypothetical protein